MWFHLKIFGSYYLEDDCYTWSLVCTIFWYTMYVMKNCHSYLQIWSLTFVCCLSNIRGLQFIHLFIVEVVKMFHVDSFLILMLLLFEDVDIMCIWPLFCFSLKGEMRKFSTTSGTKQNCKILFSSTKFVLVPLVVQKLHTSAYKEKAFPNTLLVCHRPVK